VREKIGESQVLVDQTFFDPDAYRPTEEKSYPAWLEAKSRSGRFDSDEWSIFSHVCEHEVFLHEARGCFFGNLTLHDTINDRIIRGHDECLSNPARVPSYVERDGLAINVGDARGVIIVEHTSVFRLMMELNVADSLNVILFTGAGIPRYSARRLLHRLQEEFSLAVYLLTDNDTWGYFIYSILARGALPPNMSHPPSSLSLLSFLGIRSTDCDEFGVKTVGRPWRPVWDVRVQQLRKHACFGTPEWQQELGTFCSNRRAVGLREFIDAVGSNVFLAELVAKRLRGD
jgi:DNA topoisomerase VI subunit A